MVRPSEILENALLYWTNATLIYRKVTEVIERGAERPQFNEPPPFNQGITENTKLLNFATFPCLRSCLACWPLSSMSRVFVLRCIIASSALIGKLYPNVLKVSHALVLLQIVLLKFSVNRLITALTRNWPYSPTRFLVTFLLFSSGIASPLRALSDSLFLVFLLPISFAPPLAIEAYHVPSKQHDACLTCSRDLFSEVLLK